MSVAHALKLSAERRGRSLALRWHSPALVFVAPYLILFALFVAYPVVYGVWLGKSPAVYQALVADPVYRRAVKNTLIFVIFGVNVKLLLALVLSGFFVVNRRWIKVLLPLFILPWAVPTVSAMLSIRFMLDSQWGILNGALNGVGISQAPLWLLDYKWAMVSSIVAYIWKSLPFWTLILIAARLSIPRSVYEAAEVDGASGFRMFRSVTFPMIRNVYLTSTLLSTIWTLSEYNSVRFITGGGPGDLTHVFATLGVRYAFEQGDVALGVGLALTSLPLLIPLIVLLVRRLKKEGTP